MVLRAGACWLIKTEEIQPPPLEEERRTRPERQRRKPQRYGFENVHSIPYCTTTCQVSRRCNGWYRASWPQEIFFLGEPNWYHRLKLQEYGKRGKQRQEMLQHITTLLCPKPNWWCSAHFLPHWTFPSSPGIIQRPPEMPQYHSTLVREYDKPVFPLSQYVTTHHIPNAPGAVGGVEQPPEDLKCFLDLYCQNDFVFCLVVLLWTLSSDHAFVKEERIYWELHFPSLQDFVKTTKPSLISVVTLALHNEWKLEEVAHPALSIVINLLAALSFTSYMIYLVK